VIKKDIGWKVVSVIEGKLHSSSSCFLFDVEYFVDRFVSRKEGFGPLCLFKTLKAARQYCINFKKSNPYSMKIFKAEYIPSEDKALWYVEPFQNSHITNRVELKDLKSEYTVALHLIKTEDFITADQIKLLKE